MSFPQGEVCSCDLSPRGTANTVFKAGALSAWRLSNYMTTTMIDNIHTKGLSSVGACKEPHGQLSEPNAGHFFAPLSPT
jgi:hypothetical protein